MGKQIVKRANSSLTDMAGIKHLPAHVCQRFFFFVVAVTEKI